MFEDIKERVCKANTLLPKYNLVTFTWGNVSECNREKGIVAIKPSGVDYDLLTAKDIVIVDFDGNVIEGDLKPSVDLPTHLELYKAFHDIGGIVHTHSRWATSFAQAGKPIPALGTTQADYFYGDISCTRELRDDEIEGNYEKNTGLVIADAFKNLDPCAVPGVLVKNHGPFAWGKDGFAAVHNAVVMEEVAFMDLNAMILTNGNPPKVSQTLLNKHYFRKHGKNATYGQIKK